MKDNKYKEMSNILLEIPKCSCGGTGKESHRCPYREDIHNNPDVQCNCCDACKRECAADV